MINLTSIVIDGLVNIGSIDSEPSGSQLYSTAGTYSFIVPDNITLISAVAVGAGGSGTANIGGSVYYGADGGFSQLGSFIKAGGGGGSIYGGAGAGGIVVTGTGGAGGYAGAGTSGGGGAGGYTGNGGDGISQNNHAPAGGGGGTGLYGQGANGYGGDGHTRELLDGDPVNRLRGLPGNGGGGGGGGHKGGGGGSGGQNATDSVYDTGRGGDGGWPGGGGGSNYWVYSGIGGGGGALAYANNIAVTPGQVISVIVGAKGTNDAPVGQRAGFGADGAIRIIWGSGKTFPLNAT